MTTRSTTVLLATLAGAALVPATAAQAAGGGFGCSARTLGGSVLGQALPLGGAAGEDTGACRDADAALALPGLLGRGVASAQTRVVGTGVATQRATATASVADLALGSLDGLASSLPAITLPAGLDAITVPLPKLADVPALPGAPALPAVPAVPGLPGVPLPSDTTALPVGTVPTGVALPPSVTIDVREAVRALVPERLLPQLDVLRVGAATTRASASCVGGAPLLEGASELASVRVLGEEVGVGATVDRALALLPAGTVPLDGVDLRRIALPAGLSFDAPVVGPVLADAVRTALAALPPIDLDAVAARVQVTPSSQERTPDRLVQRGPRVFVSALGASLVDVTLGVAQVSQAGVDCGAAPAAPAALTGASDLALQCTTRKVTLIDVTENAGHVALLGATSAANAGRKVAIVFAATGKKVAEGVVRPTGFFRAQAALPAKAIRGTNAARYMAVIDGSQSLKLKLTRRMRISKLSHQGSRVLITGSIAGPLVPGEEIVIRRKVSCTKDVVAKRFMPQRSGTWRVWVDAPTDGQAAAYRASTQVFGIGEATRRFDTFTLPGYVSL